MLVLATLAALSVFSGSLLYISALREEAAITIHELSRLLIGQPLARITPAVQVAKQSGPLASSNSQAERIVAEMLAAKLKVPVDHIRVQLSVRSTVQTQQLAREHALYGTSADSQLIGPLSVGLRLPDGTWRLVRNSTLPPLGLGRLVMLCALITGLIVGAAIWLGRRLAATMRQFAAAAEAITAGEVQPVPIKGPAELQAAASAINLMQERITRYVRERTSMIGAIAHDLRAPLARLEFHLVNAPPDVAARFRHEMDEMEQIIGATLTFVEEDSRAVGIERLELSSLVEAVTEDFSLAGKDVQLIATTPITLVGSAVLLKRAFTNLIDNAVKYGERAEITVSRRSNEAVVTVCDKGPGLTEGDLDRAFEPFYRGERSRNRRTGGVGLGLAIVRTAVSKHNGSITLENLPPGGLCATVTLPI